MVREHPLVVLYAVHVIYSLLVTAAGVGSPPTKTSAGAKIVACFVAPLIVCGMVWLVFSAAGRL